MIWNLLARTETLFLNSIPTDFRNFCKTNIYTRTHSDVLSAPFWFLNFIDSSTCNNVLRSMEFRNYIILIAARRKFIRILSKILNKGMGLVDC